MVQEPCRCMNITPCKCFQWSETRHSLGSFLTSFTPPGHRSSGGSFLSCCLWVLFLTARFWGSGEAQHPSGWQLPCSLLWAMPYCTSVTFHVYWWAVSLGSPDFPWERLIIASFPQYQIPPVAAKCWSCLNQILLPAPLPWTLEGSKWSCTWQHSSIWGRCFLVFWVIPYWPSEEILGLWIAQLWWRLKALIAKLW